jgi:hypothetical protein
VDELIIDGAINWRGGSPATSAPGFDIEPRKAAIYEWVRQVRGGVLAGAFTVERHLSAAITFFLLGRRVEIAEVRDTFNSLMGPLSFERRINVALSFAPLFVAADEIKSLKKDLGELRALRNAMAHSPFWFEPCYNSMGELEELMPMLMKGKGRLVLTSACAGEINALIRSLIDRSNSMAEAVVNREQL